MRLERWPAALLPLLGAPVASHGGVTSGWHVAALQQSSGRHSNVALFISVDVWGGVSEIHHAISWPHCPDLMIKQAQRHPRPCRPTQCLGLAEQHGNGGVLVPISRPQRGPCRGFVKPHLHDALHLGVLGHHLVLQPSRRKSSPFCWVSLPWRVCMLSRGRSSRRPCLRSKPPPPLLPHLWRLP